MGAGVFWKILLTFVATGKTKGRNGPDDAEDVMGQYGVNPALPGVGLQECEARPRGGDDLLLLGPRELTQQSLRDCRRRLDGQRVQEHVRCRRHDSRGAQKAGAALLWWGGSAILQGGLVEWEADGACCRREK